MITGTEIHTEQFEVGGLTIKIYVMVNQATKHYTVFCKALDPAGSMLWRTELLGRDGEPQTFHSLTHAVTKTRSIFHSQKAVSV